MATRILLETFFDGLGATVPTEHTILSAKYSRVRTDGAEVIHPKTVEVKLVDGVLTEPFLLTPTGVDWYCTLTIRFLQLGTRIERTVAIPDVPEVAWGDLVDIDPKTMQPSTGAQAAWDLAIAEVQTLTLSATAAAAETVEKASEAEVSANTATTKAAEAEAARVAAVAAVASVPGEVAEAIAADDTIVQAAAAGVSGAVAGLSLVNVRDASSATAFALGSAYAKGAVVEHAGWLWYALPPTDVITRTNRVPNPGFAADGASGAGWTSRTGSSRVAGTWTVGTEIPKGNEVCSSGYATGWAAATVAGDVWSMRATITVDATSPALTLFAGVSFGPTLATTFPSSATVVIQPGETKTVTHLGAVAPATRTTAILSIRAGEIVPVGAKFTITDPMLVKGATITGSAFTGATPTATTPTSVTTFAWAGTVDASASVATTTITAISGAPGVIPDWLRLWGQPAARAIGTLSATPVTVAPNTVPSWMDRTRTKMWTGGTLTLKESVDDGATWYDLHTFPGAVGTPREFGNGELVVSVDQSGTLPKTLWVSSGYPTLGPAATWTQKVVPTSPQITFTGAWSTFVHDNIGLYAEYGPKVGTPYNGQTVAAGENARYIYMTVDHGKTWKTIFDVNQHVTNGGTGIHMHGVAWDKWWDRIWVTFGDSQNGTMYSDDLGTTWEFAEFSATDASSSQNVGILPMPDCVLFGTDVAPNGIQRINRSEGKRTGLYPIDIAYKINEATVRNALCQGIFWAEAAGAPAFFTFGAETNPSKSCIVGTRDGYTFEKVWEAATEQTAGNGLRNAIGPTARGRMFARMSDPDGGGSWQMLKGKSPGY